MDTGIDTPGSTVSIADSVIRATKGMAETLRGTIAATGPYDVPVISLVKGMMATIRITKGIDLRC